MQSAGGFEAEPETPETEREAVEIARLLDGAVAARILVLGPFPPQGRDLDIVARASERRVIGSTLAAHGLLPRSSDLSPPRRWVQQWVRFTGAGAFAVDVHPPARWALPSRELEAVFSEGLSVDGFEHVARCAAHHVLLLIARSRIAGGAPLGAKRRVRIDRALAEDPGAWALAAERSGAWGLQRGLAVLEGEYHGAVPSRGALALARAELLAATVAKGGLAAPVRRAGQKRPRSTRIVSLSGLDGAGKSSQAEALQRTLAGVGVDAVIEWMPLGHSPRNPTLRFIRRSAMRILELPRGRHARPSDPATPATGTMASPAGSTAAPGLSPLRALRERSRAGTHVWATTVAVIQAWQHRRAALRHVGSGKIVIFDRYTLDSAAQLRYFYGASNDFRVQKWLIQRISPKARCSYLLDVSAQTLLTRKELQYSPAEVALQVRLYQEEAGRHSVRRLDGERPMDEISEEIARDVWKGAG